MIRKIGRNTSIFSNRDGEWKYFESGQSWKGLRDVREDLGLEQTEDQEPSGMTEIT